MNKQTRTMRRENILGEQINSRPLTFVEFCDRVRYHTADLSAVLKDLRGISTILETVAKIKNSDIGSIVKPVALLSEQVSVFCVFIEQSTYLPLSVIPYRLPLIIALKEGEADLGQINKMYAEFSKISRSDVGRDEESLQIFGKKLEELSADIEEIITQSRLLLDRARFPVYSS